MHDFKLIEIPFTEENLISYDYIMKKAGYWGGGILDELNKTVDLLSSRQDTIHNKGFDLFNFNYAVPEALADDEKVSEYSKIKVGVKQLEDAILELGTLRTARLPFCNKAEIMKAIV